MLRLNKNTDQRIPPYPSGAQGCEWLLTTVFYLVHPGQAPKQVSTPVGQKGHSEMESRSRSTALPSLLLGLALSLLSSQAQSNP